MVLHDFLAGGLGVKLDSRRILPHSRIALFVEEKKESRRLYYLLSLFVI
jgi:hypothetical protein